MLSISPDGITWWPEPAPVIGTVTGSQSFTVGACNSVRPAGAPSWGTITNGTSKQLNLDWNAASSTGISSEAVDGNRPISPSTALSTTVTYRVKNSTTGGYLAETTSTAQNQSGLSSDTSYSYYISSRNAYVTYTYSAPSKVGTTRVDAVTVTKSYGCRWSQSYEGDGSKRTDVGSTIYHDEYSSSRGNHRGLFVFDSISIPTNATINWVKLFLHAEHWYYGAGGQTSLYLSATSNSSEPSSWGSGATYLCSTELDYNGTGDQWQTIPDAFGQYLRGNGYRQFMVGSSSSISRYGYFTGNSGTSNDPQLQINYTYYT